MNTEEINNVLKRLCTENFDSVFSVDNLPEKPRLLVANTDPANRPGRHWVCIYVDNGYGEYFGSLGHPPTVNFTRYLNVHCSSWIFNREQIQSVISRFCGHYCVYYCMLRCKGIDMPKIVSSFTSDTAPNDVLVHGFVCRIVNK